MFPITTLPEDAPDLLEQLGTKEKFWFRRAGARYLFKLVRQETGEDWSEKVASEIAALLGLPHARYAFGGWKSLRGVETPSFVPEAGRLVHGNELIGKVVPEYPGTRCFRVRQHTVKLVLAVLSGNAPSPPIAWASIPVVASGV